MKLTLPQLPPQAGLELAQVRQLKTEASLERIMLVHVDATGLRASNLSLDEAILEKVSLIEARLEKLRLSDAELKTCDLSAARCSESSWIRVRARGGRMAGLDLSRSVINDVIFENCKLDMANFRFAKLTRVQFTDCSMRETDFQMAELNDVVFQTSHLEKTEFHQCKLKAVDARSSELVGIRGWQSLKGLTIDSTQLVTIAPQLALDLGLVIQD